MKASWLLLTIPLVVMMWYTSNEVSLHMANHHKLLKEDFELKLKEKYRQRPPVLREPIDEGLYNSIRHMVGVGGNTTYNFVITSAYRTGPGTFSVVGLADKKLYEKEKFQFQCEWHMPNGNGIITGTTWHARTDWKFGRTYTALVVHCYFENQASTQYGGALHVLTKPTSLKDAHRIVALEEKHGDYKESDYPGGQGFRYKYDYLYCGSSLFGDVDPNRLSQWIAYHAMLFGNRSHFIFHDAGAFKLHPENQRVVEPWVKAGRVTVEDFTEQAKFDGWYHNQFLVVNDCMMGHKHDAKWTFFFDNDEYIHVPPPHTLESVLAGYQNYAQVTFKQRIMSPDMCLAKEAGSGKWEIEKLVFRNVKDIGNHIRRDRKYVIQARLANSAGVHLSQHIRRGSKTLVEYEGLISYYHYHNTINKHNDTCTQILNLPEDKKKWIWIGKDPYVYDDSMGLLAQAAKDYEKQIIGSQASKPSGRFGQSP